MIDGIYSMTYRGHADWGMGMLVFLGGVVTGASVGAVTFDGQYVELSDEVTIDVTMHVPAGVPLVTGKPAQPQPYEVPFTATISKAALESGETVAIDMGLGPVNAIFQKLRSLPDPR